MTSESYLQETVEPERLETDEGLGGEPGVSRREFVELLGGGLLLTVSGDIAFGQRRGFGGFGASGPANIATRLHLGNDGTMTVMTGKVELGQGARAELTQAAAEELRVAADQVRLIMADTGLVPNDGITAGSQTTPRIVPVVRRAAAAARELLVGLACKQWRADRGAVEVKDGVITHAATKRTMSYADLARAENVAKTLAQAIPADISLTPVRQWTVLGTSLARPNGRDIVTGAHRYPSDIVRPGMLYGKALRAPSYGATLTAIDLAPAKAMEGVVVVRDGAFVGCAALTLFQAKQAVEAIAKTATWKTSPHPSSRELFSHLRKHVQPGRGDRGRSGAAEGSPEKAIAGAAKALHQSYEIAYIQHAPMEPRAGVAEWNDGKLTVWASTANPFGVRGELADAVELPAERIRVIVPDLGCAFGGKHQGEAAVEAARLARAAGRPVSVRWTREEEFTWAYFRPAGLIEVRGGLDANGSLIAWDFTNINSGGAGIDTPYEVPNRTSRSVGSNSPLRQGSYRALAATANNFARESFMDELAHAAGSDPLAFRLAHLKNPRLRAVLESAVKEFGWTDRHKDRAANIGLGLACGTEKGSYVAACVEVAIDRDQGKIQVRRICQAFECGAILNPANLLSQVQGCILMGLGGALTEEIRFEDGKILNAKFSRYQVPRFKDVPELDIHLLNRPDLDSAGGGETPIIAVAPAIAGAVFQATGVRIRSMPIRLKL
jgi:CO/xanthine dehydrogenase Mo-binding subunit